MSRADLCPIAADLFEEDSEGLRLIGARRKSDGVIVFPAPSAVDPGFERVRLAPAGTLWSFTVQRFRPKPPYARADDEQSFRPYAVGYVELPGQVIVESRLAVEDFAQLRIGMRMRLDLEVFERASAGPALIFVFRPDV